MFNAGDDQAFDVASADQSVDDGVGGFGGGGGKDEFVGLGADLCSDGSSCFFYGDACFSSPGV